MSACSFVGPPDDSRLFQCESNGACRPGFTCGADDLCHPDDAGSTGGGSAGGGAGGSTGGGSTGGGTAGSGGASAADAGPCGRPCQAGTVCGGGGATPGACSRPRVCENGFCWESPLPQGHTLHDSIAFSEDDVWLVGDHGTILHSEGGGWVGYSSGTTQALYGVHGRAPNELYAVGARCTLLRFDGARWTVEAVPTGCTEDLRAVLAMGDDSVLAVGVSQRALLREQQQWRTAPSMPTFPVPPTYFQVTQVGTETWVATDTMGAFRWDPGVRGLFVINGTEWPFANGSVTALERIGDSAYACGRFPGVLRRAAQATAWSLYVDGGTNVDETCSSICGTSEAVVFVATDENGVPRVRRHPGNGVTLPGQRTNTCAGLRQGLANLAGDHGFLAQLTSGGTLSFDSQRTLDAPQHHYRAIFSPSESSALWAPMGFGTASRRSAAGTWSDVAFTGGAQQSYGVWSSAPNDVWMTSGDGAGGRVSRFDGGLWSDLPGAMPFVYGIWGVSPNEVYVGGEGRVWTSRGLGALTSVLDLAPDMAPVRGLWGSSTWPLTGVTQGGRVVSRSLPDAGWTSQTIPGASLSALHGATLPDGGTDLWTVGQLGALFHLEGATWRFVDAGQGPIELHAVFTEGDRVWVTGQNGTVLLGASNRWERVVTPAGGNIRGVWSQADGGGVWLVGDFGQIVSKIPGR